MSKLTFSLIILLSFIYGMLFADNVGLRITPSQVNFGNVTTTVQQQNSVWVANTTNQTLQLHLKSINNRISLGDTLVTVSPADSFQLVIRINTNQNILYQDFIKMADEAHDVYGFIPVQAASHFANNALDNTYNLYDSALKTALKTAMYNHTNLGYDSAREAMFGDIDYTNAGTECVYTGFVYQNNGDIPNSDVMNTEHTWPQSMFGSPAAVQKADLNHLYPTESTANSVRGNLPFGTVVSGINWSVGGSKRGKNSSGVTCFEPRDVHKGDVARSMFYFAIVYDNPNTFLNAQEANLRLWYYQDPVSTKEINRNNAIYQHQGNRNLLVDHPEFLDRIYSISTTATTPQIPDAIIPINSIAFNNNQPSTNYTYTICNDGNANLTISSIQSNNPAFTISNAPASIPAKSTRSFLITYSDTAQNEQGTLQIQTNDGNFSVQLSSSNTATQDYQNDTPAAIKVCAYPNPFKNTIDFNSNLRGKTALKVFDIKGRLVYSTTSTNSKVTWKGVDLSGKKVAAGVYLYRMSNANANTTGKLLKLQ